MTKKKSVTLTIGTELGSIRIKYRGRSSALYAPTARWMGHFVPDGQVQEGTTTLVLSTTRTRNHTKHLMRLGETPDVVYYVVMWGNDPNFDQPILPICKRGIAGIFGYIPTHLYYKR